MVDLAGKYVNDPSMRAVSLGLDAEHFVTHDKMGQYLIERAHECRVAALEELVTVNPTNHGAITQLQWKARIPDLFLQWLDEAIAEGKAAEEIILQEEAMQ
jgi:hypothetical protein